ncbi:MAG: hypothetical protein ACSHW7_11625 [Patiriisocius sp.]|uniref:hypothetical protein n=1 Tax=Patiriisocius sp. TaxID=2822396 RepID=UPI003EF3CD00
MEKRIVEYDIILKSDLQEKGTIDLDRIAFLAKSITNIAKGALQIRLGGISYKQGKKVSYLDNALKIKLKGIKESSTLLQLETQTFESTIRGIQINAFQPEVAEELPNQTPMSLFMLAYQEAFDDQDEEKDLLDKSLLKDLKDLKTFFKSNNEELIISNRSSLPELHLKKSDFEKIKLLEDRIPDPQNVVVNGIIDILEHSKSKVTVKTEQGNLYGNLTQKSQQEKIKDFWGKEATIYGVGHFKTNGKLAYIEIERIFESSQEDKYFSKIPFSESTELQIKKQLQKNPTKNWMNEIAGQWPGNETDEEFQQLLNNI